MGKKAAPEDALDMSSESERNPRSRPRGLEPSIFDTVEVAGEPKVPALEALRAGDSLAGEEIRLLGARVWSMVQEQALMSLALVSAGPGEGKSTLSLCLATTIAEGLDRRILVVEADLRRPSLESYLDIPRAPGLGEWLTEDADRVALRRIGPRGLFVLSAGTIPFKRPELLASARMSALMEAGRAAFDLIIVDCPPLVPLADAVFLQDLVDGFLFVVRARQTPRDVLRRALGSLKPERILGTILNQQREILTSYEAKAYRQYTLRKDR